MYSETASDAVNRRKNPDGRSRRPSGGGRGSLPMIGLLMSLLAAGSAPAAPPSAQSSSTSYCCTDAQGRHLCAQVLPRQCIGRPYRQIDASGRIKHYDAPPTAEQRAHREMELAAKQEREKRMLEQRRKDMALLNMYASEAEIDVIRDRKVAEIRESIKRIEARQATLLETREQLAQREKAYVNRTIPRDLQEAERSNAAELKALQAEIDERTRELDAIVARYAQDKRRYVELREGFERTSSQ